MKSIGNYGTGGSNIILRNRQLNFVNLVATITDTRVHEDTLILVYYSEATQAAAQAAGITTETNEGNITFTAANPPSSTIVCDIVLLSANMVSQMASASDIDYSNTQSGLTSTDVQGAVDELAQSYPATQVMLSDGVTSVEDALDAVMPKTVTSVTADGVKTYAQLLTELFNLGSGGNVLKIGSITFHVTNQANYSACYFGGENVIDVYAIYMNASIALYKKFSITSNGTVTFTNLSNNIPTSGIKIEKVRI